jgi:hypothetical protein
MAEIDIDDNGAPILLAVRKPGQVAAQPDASGAIVRRGAQSGNPNFDPITGKFAGKKLRKLEVIQQAGDVVQQGAVPMRSGVPNGVSPHVWERRMDVVREAARLTDYMDAVSITSFLAEKVADVAQVDINAFMTDVRAQRIADLVDSLEAKVKGRQAKQPVRVVAPGRWTTRVFNELTQAEALSLVKRLEGKGWDAADITKHVVGKMKNKELRDFLEQSYGETKIKPGTTKRY